MANLRMAKYGLSIYSRLNLNVEGTFRLMYCFKNVSCLAKENWLTGECSIYVKKAFKVPASRAQTWCKL